MDNIDTKAFSAKADGILKKISNLILEEIEDVEDENTIPLLLLVLTKLSANLLLGFQKAADDDVDVTEQFIKYVRELMPILEREWEIQAKEEQIQNIKERIAELERKRDDIIMNMFVKNDGQLN